jgi:hypothetical protein
MPAHRKRKRDNPFPDIPVHVTRGDVEKSWRRQCTRRKYHMPLSANLSLSELRPLRYVVIGTTVDLYSHVMSMCLELAIDSGTMERLFAAITKLHAMKRLNGLQIFTVILHYLKTGRIFTLPSEIIMVEENFNPPDLFGTEMRVKRRLEK